MLPSIILRRLLSWIALAAILGLALTPALAQMLARGGPSEWMQICSAQGSKLVAVADLAPDESPAPSTAHLEHCPFCVLHAPLLPTPQWQVSFFAPTAPPARYPKLFFPAPRPLFAWSAGQARAPPAINF